MGYGEPSQATSTNYVESFRKLFDLTKIPDILLREKFEIFLQNRAGARANYLRFPEEGWNRGFGDEGDSPHKKLIHQIGNGRLRIEAMISGKLDQWEYSNRDMNL